MQYLILPQVKSQADQDEELAAEILFREQEYAEYAKNLAGYELQLKDEDLLAEYRTRLEQLRADTLKQMHVVEKTRVSLLERLPEGDRRTAAVSAVVAKEAARKAQESEAK